MGSRGLRGDRPDLVGHGELRQHPFPESNPHDYHFRYDAALQFYPIGESLMGWFVWDLMRAVDVLLKNRASTRSG